MDINEVITKINEAQVIANAYKNIDEKITALTSQESGTLEVNGISLSVTGEDFIALLDAEITELSDQRDVLFTDLENKINSISFE